MLEGLRKPTELIVVVITLLAYGCPIQAIVHAFDLDERTVARWRYRAGQHCQKLHQAVVAQATLDLMHIQGEWLAAHAIASLLIGCWRRCAAVVRCCDQFWSSPMAGRRIRAVFDARSGRK